MKKTKNKIRKSADSSQVNEENISENKNWFRRKYDYTIKIIKNLLLQGISPEKIAMAMAMGFLAGTFPLLGTHTILGIALAFVFGLNQVAVYLGAWLSIPAYFMMLLPSLRIGEYLFSAKPMDLDAFVAGLKRMTHSLNDFFSVWGEYGYSIVHLVIGWIPLAILVCTSVYFIMLYIARMFTKAKT